MTLNTNSTNEFNEFDDIYDEIGRAHVSRGGSRQRHRASKHRAQYEAKKSRQEILASVAAETERVIDFNPTYLQNFDPDQQEYMWVHKNLAGFYQDEANCRCAPYCEGGQGSECLYLCGYRIERLALVGG